MKIETQAVEPVVTTWIGERDRKRIRQAELALTRLNASPAVIAGFRSLAGVENPLSRPCGADVAARAALAHCLSERIATGYDFSDGPSYTTFEIANTNWQCPADRVRIPHRTMLGETIGRIKKTETGFAYALAVRIVRVDEKVVVQPVLRVLVSGLGLSDAQAAIIDSIRRDLGGGSADTVYRTEFRPLTKSILTAKIARMLELRPARRATPATPSRRAQTNALLRMMIHAAQPFGLVAGGTGQIKTALRGAVNEVKASSKDRLRTKTTIASEEIYSWISDIPMILNGHSIRAPFWGIS